MAIEFAAIVAANERVELYLQSVSDCSQCTTHTRAQFVKSFTRDLELLAQPTWANRSLNDSNTRPLWATD